MTTYPGGKNGAGVFQRIINHMPPHTTYIEPFLGAGAIMRAKRPAVVSIGIDADANVIEMWQLSRESGIPPANLTLLYADALTWLDSHTKGSNMINTSTLIYLDPPYLLSTRRQQRPIYRYELSKQDHVRLLDIIITLPCMVIISGYWSELYAEALKGWRTDHFQSRTRGGTTATEWLWMNYPTPFELHDYRYLGVNYRERERIKRKKQRWTARLQAMPPLERYAMLAVLGNLVATPEATMVTSKEDPLAKALESALDQLALELANPTKNGEPRGSPETEV